MNVSGNVSAILAHKKISTVWSIGPNVMVSDVIRLMDEKNVGALPVVDKGTLVGIVSERDYTQKVILKGRPSCWQVDPDYERAPVLRLQPA